MEKKEEQSDEAFQGIPNEILDGIFKKNTGEAKEENASQLPKQENLQIIFKALITSGYDKIKLF